MGVPLSRELLNLALPSGSVFTLTMSELLLSISTIVLFFEIMNATSAKSSSIFNHGLSLVLFIACGLIFLFVPGFGTGTFLIITLMSLVDVVPADGEDAGEVLLLAGALEHASEHPIARAVANAATDKFGALPDVQEFGNIEGLGVQGLVDTEGGSPKETVPCRTLPERRTRSCAMLSCRQIRRACSSRTPDPDPSR